MARRAIVRYEGAIYHMMNRGIDRRLLFRDDNDRSTLLESLEIGVERFLVWVHACCLMQNHFHLLVETPLGNDEGTGVCLGDAEALRELEERLERRALGGAPAGFEGTGVAIRPEDVLGEVLRGLKIGEEELYRRRGSAWMRGVAAEILCRYGGLTNTQAAERLGLGTGGIGVYSQECVARAVSLR